MGHGAKVAKYHGNKTKSYFFIALKNKKNHCFLKVLHGGMVAGHERRLMNICAFHGYAGVWAYGCMVA